MGYYIFSYGINTGKIAAAFHSGDEKILQQVQETDTFDSYRDFLPSGKKTTPEKAIDDIIKNKPYDTESNFAYGYALICMCDALGEKLPYMQEIKLGYETDFVNECLDEDFNIEEMEIENKLFEKKIPFEIPAIDDWPMIGFLGGPGLAELKKTLSKIKITEEEIDELFEGDEADDDKGCAYQHIKGIMDNIDYCIDNNLEMISFCH